ncbi:uncharacterized protein (DUF2252 family) [Paraburkholderia sp. WC7.3d]
MTRKSAKKGVPCPDERQPLLSARRKQKMARSAHAYVRGSASRFYDWLDSQPRGRLPEGPAVWIGGDCHLGNLGPVADATGNVAIQIRDLDQSVIGNPLHDLLRLGLSLATAARSSDLPGVVTSSMIDALADGYEQAFDDSRSDATKKAQRPDVAKIAMDQALHRSWRRMDPADYRQHSASNTARKAILAAIRRGTCGDSRPLRERVCAPHSCGADRQNERCPEDRSTRCRVLGERLQFAGTAPLCRTAERR